MHIWESSRAAACFCFTFAATDVKLAELSILLAPPLHPASLPGPQEGTALAVASGALVAPRVAQTCGRVNLLAGYKCIISHNQPAVRCTRGGGGGSCRWSGTSPVQIYSAGGRLWDTEDRIQKSAFLGGS